MNTSRIQNIILWFVCIILAGLIAALIVAMVNSISDALLGLAMITYAPRSPFLPRLMPCPVCKIDTVHHFTLSGEAVCWCGAVTKPEDVPSTGPETSRHLFQITGSE